jgi:hypothetical protein
MSNGTPRDERCSAALPTISQAGHPLSGTPLDTGVKSAQGKTTSPGEALYHSELGGVLCPNNASFSNRQHDHELQHASDSAVHWQHAIVDSKSQSTALDPKLTIDSRRSQRACQDCWLKLQEALVFSWSSQHRRMHVLEHTEQA